MKKKIVDVFPYFDPTGRELLELRIKMLYDYVDEFVIAESNRTQSGIPIERNLRNVLREFNIPSDKIIIVDLDIPDDDNLEIQPIDGFNCYYEGVSNIFSLRARARERMQKNAILSMLYRYSDDTQFICSDSDEIINPEAIWWISNIVSDNTILTIPLINLQARADLRVFNTSINNWWRWDALFLATKKQLMVTDPNRIRSNYMPIYEKSFPMQDGRRVEDLGWHFSWMGDKSKRKIKLDAFSHYSDKSNEVDFGGYSTQELREKIIEQEYKDGSPSPNGYINSILKKHPIETLPKIIFDIPKVKKLLLPHLE